ncbi:uncharacterized protein [Chlorocebus sabaeus]|uniref:uncharacterized protein n=1 Tax=Chlorocebus sabaeus TaxID=60711 RepID=UPI003BFA0B3F
MRAGPPDATGHGTREVAAQSTRVKIQEHERQVMGGARRQYQKDACREAAAARVAGKVTGSRSTEWDQGRTWRLLGGCRCGPQAAGFHLATEENLRGAQSGISRNRVDATAPVGPGNRSFVIAKPAALSFSHHLEDLLSKLCAQRGLAPTAGAAGPAANFRIQVGSPRPNSTPPRHRRSPQVQGFPPPRRSRPLKVSLTRPGRCSPRSIPPHPGAPPKRCDPRPPVVSPPPDAAPAPTCGTPGISEVPNQSLPAHPRVSSTRDAAPPAGTPPTCGAIPTSAAHLTASTAPTYDDPGVGAPAHSRTPPAPAPFPAPSHAPAPAAPPVRSGPARHRPLALGRGGAAVPTPAGAGRVHIAYCAPGLAAPLDLLAMDTDDSQAPKGSLRKFLEHLSGAGKAVGVLTRGEDAQDAWKGADGGFPPVSGPRTEQGWSGNGPPPSVPVTFPSPLSARGGTGAACWGAVSAAPPAASAYVMPGPSSPCALALASVRRALPEPAAQPP